MTPKEKAEQLMKYFDLPQYNKEKNIVFTSYHFSIEQRKYCVLKYIDEKLNETFENSNDYYFIVQLRKEIEKL
jgi:hypothetical protein